MKLPKSTINIGKCWLPGKSITRRDLSANADGEPKNEADIIKGEMGIGTTMAPSHKAVAVAGEVETDDTMTPN
jgi:hypothetical protein